MKNIIPFLLCSSSISLSHAAENPNPTGFTRMVRPRLNPPEPNVEPQTDPFQLWKQTSGILEKCLNEEEKSAVLRYFESGNYSGEWLTYVTELMKTSGMWDKCQNGKEIKSIIMDLRIYSYETLNCMRNLRVWDKCQNGKDIERIVSNFLTIPHAEINNILELMVTSGILDKCRNGDEISKILGTLHEPVEIFAYAPEWMKASGALDKCRNGKDIYKLLWGLSGFSSREKITFMTDWMKASGFWDKCQNGKDIGIIGELVDYPLEKLYPATDWMKISGAWDKCDILQITNILRKLVDYPQKNLDFVTDWMKASGVWDKCQNGIDIAIIGRLVNYPLEKLYPATDWMKISGVWDKCNNPLQIASTLCDVADYPLEKLYLATDWMKISGAWDKCQNLFEIDIILRELVDCSQKKLNFATEWMKVVGAWDKCQNGEEIRNILLFIKEYPKERLGFIAGWMKASGAWDKCQNGNDLGCIISYFLSITPQKLYSTTDWIKTTGIIDKCQDGDEITLILRDLSESSPREITFMTDWMKISGAWNKCHNGKEIFHVLNPIKDYHPENLVFVTKWMKTSGAWDKCQNGDVLGDVLYGLMTFDIQTLYNMGERLSIRKEFLPIYIIGSTLNNISGKCKEALHSFIENPDTRVNTLDEISYFLGEESTITQEFLFLALGYDNSNDPNGFLSVYREMMEKREELVSHPLKTQTPGVILNLARTQEPRTMAPIHMPLNVWTRLFDTFKLVEKESFNTFYGDVSYNNLLKLETDQNITDLLDPKDSLVVKDRISSHSFMLRDVLERIHLLHQINPMAAMPSFSQLLVNMTTCPTGKLNGITHTYLLMNKDTVLDEGELGSTAFIQRIIHHFNEELRRFREGTLSAMVKGIVKDAYADPHDVLYVRGIIGGDVGLLFAGEIPKIDMNANMVSPILRQMSKQDLLNLFYQYYTVEEVITLFHTKLNNGSFKIEDLGSGKNLTLKVINEFLREDAFDVETERYNPDYIVLDPSGKPVGLTLAAAKNLLLQMGFLTAVPQ